MFAQERQQLILDLVAQKRRLTLTDLQAKLGASPATVRRDLDVLARAGKVLRTHGGVLHPDVAQGEVSFDRKARAAVEAKHALATVAAALVPSEGVVFVDAGSTTLAVGRALLDRPALRIYTNSLPLLCLAPEARATLVAIGGEVRPLGLALTGALAQHWLQNLRFDLAVIGASGLDPADGASTTETTEAAVKSEALRRATRRVLVAHAGKWAAPAALRFAPWSSFTDFVTDHVFTRAERLTLGGAGLRIHSLST